MNEGFKENQNNINPNVNPSYIEEKETNNWNKAKRIDPNVATEANRLIGRYSQFMPSKEDIFQRNLKAGEMLDGEGGYCVYGKIAPATHSLATGALPLGLAHGVHVGGNDRHASR